MKVLIVEDHYAWREKFTKAFELAGHQVVASFYNSTGVLEAASQLKPDLLVLDICLGYSTKTGVDLANELQHLQIPFIYVTGKEEEAIHIQAYKQGNAQAFRYLYKMDFFREPHRVIKNLARELQFNDPTFVIEGETFIRERFSNVLCIFGEGKSGQIICKGGKIHPYKGQLKQFIQFQQQFIEPYLYQANRNHLINIHQITSWVKEGQRQFRVFFDDAQQVLENGILVSQRNSQKIITTLNSLHRKLN